MKWHLQATSVIFFTLILSLAITLALTIVMAEPISEDTVIISTSITRGEGDRSPGYEETSEYMMGEIAVSVILPESDGEHEAESEDWNSSEKQAIQEEISDGLRWWIDRAEENGIMIDFTIEFHTVQTGYEPITHKSMTSTEGQGMWLWIDEIMADLGHSEGYHDGVISYVNAVRDQQDTDWAFVIFVIDSSEDPDGRFSDDKFAFSFLGGPSFIMTYDNSNYGIENMDAVTAHETGHIFYALDQYSGEGSPEERSGYLNVENRNHVDGGSTDESCIMRGEVEPYSQGSVSNATKEMIGWKDTDDNTIPDILDTIPSISLIDPIGESPISILTFNGISSVNPYPNSNPYGSGNDVTVNTVEGIEYRIDDEGWQDAIPQDGAFDQEIEEFTLITDPLSNGEHVLTIRVLNDVGKVNITTHDFLVNVTHPPEISVLEPMGGTYSKDIIIDWNASDEDGEITGILLQYQYEGEVVNITGWIGNEPPFIWNITDLRDGEYYVQILARDNSSAISLNTSSTFIIDVPHAPALNIVYPTNNGNDELEGIIEIFWVALDDDDEENENLTFDIILSLDGVIPLVTLVDGVQSSETFVNGNDYHYFWNTERSPPDENRVPDGEYYLIITATDPSPYQLNATQTSGPFILDNNDVPTADFIVSSIEINEDDPVTLTIIDATDPDGDILEYHWDLGDDRSFITSDTTVNVTYTSRGFFIISLFVSDGELGTSIVHSINVMNIAPVADAGDDIIVEEDVPFTLSAASTYDTPSDLDTLIYSWEIMDSQYFRKEIELSLPSGNYQAILHVFDDDGAADSDIVNVTVVNVPPIAHAGYDQFANMKEEVSFNASFTIDSPSDQDELIYHWDFGDGNEGNGISPVHSYASPGGYTVQLTVTDDDGDLGFDEMSVFINSISVIAHIDPVPERFNPGEAVHLSAYTTTHPDGLSLSHIWDLGNGVTGYGIEISHTYDTPGLFRIQLEVQDSDNHTETDESYFDTLDIWINTPPVPDIRIHSTLETGESVEFDATNSYDSDGIMSKIMWDFGDDDQEIYVDDPDDPDFAIRSGGLQQGLIIHHVYEKEGDYIVILTISDNDGYSVNESSEISVEGDGRGLSDMDLGIDIPVVGHMDLIISLVFFCFLVVMVIGLRNRNTASMHARNEVQGSRSSSDRKSDRGTRSGSEQQGTNRRKSHSARKKKPHKRSNKRSEWR